MTEDKSDGTSELDRQLAEARERVAKKRGAAESGVVQAQGSQELLDRAMAKEEKERLRLERRARQEAERAKKREEREAERERRRQEREQLKAQKKAEREALRVPHLSKVDRARDQLPEMSDAAKKAYEDIVAQAHLSSMDLDAIGRHLQHAYRERMTEESLRRELVKGQRVVLAAGPHAGKTGVVSSPQRIRCYVDVEGLDRPVYCFTAEVVPLEDEEGKEGDPTNERQVDERAQAC